jgi:UDP-glucose 4-epimerase
VIREAGSKSSLFVLKIAAEHHNRNALMVEQRIILTGTSGTLGFHVLEKLAATPNTKVLALLRTTSKIRKTHPCVEFQSVNFDDSKSIQEIISRFAPTALIHCAASMTRFERTHWFDMIRFNVNTTLQLCECVSHVPGCHFVYIGTGLAYKEQGRPLREEDPLETPHPYGASKAAADLLVRAAAAEFKVRVTILRPFSFTGIADDRERLFPGLLRAAAEGRPFELAPGDQVRDYCAAQDIAEGIVAATLRNEAATEGPRVFNLGSGSSEPLKCLVERVARELELNVELRFGARCYMPFEPKFLVANIVQAENALGWTPRTNLAYSVWQLAIEHFPQVKVKRPVELK